MIYVVGTLSNGYCGRNYPYFATYEDEAIENYQDDCFSNSYWSIVSKEEFS